MKIQAKVFKNEGFNVIHSHIDNGQDFLSYEPTEQYDAIITNPPFSIKNKIFERCIELNKPFCLLMSATSIQSASFVKVISKNKNKVLSIIKK
jgi:tRNA1(Val) A37 N6-methylase TrmN6